MPISQARVTDWVCDVCGGISPRLTWLAVDAVERPELLANFQDLVEMECQACGHAVPRSISLLVLRAAKTAPLLVGCANDDEQNPFDDLAEVVAEIHSALGDADRVVSGPAIPISFEQLRVALLEDIDADVQLPSEARHRPGAATAEYQEVLDRVKMVQSFHRIQAGLDQLVRVANKDQLDDVIQQYPELATEEAQQAIELMLSGDTSQGIRTAVAPIREVIRLIRQGDTQAAWLTWESNLRQIWDAEIAPRLEMFQAGDRSQDPKSLAEAGLQLLGSMPPNHSPEQEALIGARTVAALLADEGPDRPQSIERAIDLAHRVIAVLDTHPEIDRPDNRGILLMNLGMAHSERPKGDPTENLTVAIDLLSESLRYLQATQDRDSWAMTLTNLATLLLEQGDPSDVDEARAHLELALTHRSRRRNARDWAFTQISLGVVHSHSHSGHQPTNLRRAIRHTVRGRYAARKASDLRLLAQAEFNLCVQQLNLVRTLGAESEDLDDLLRRAEESAKESARLCPIESSPLQFGRAWFLAAEIRLANGNRQGAIAALRTALTGLASDVAPSDARASARMLLRLAEDEGELDIAADAAERLAEATSRAIFKRSMFQDRQLEQREQESTDFRFAAAALVRADRLEAAVLALEAGRGRELGLLTLGDYLDLDTLSHVDPDLSRRVNELAFGYRSDILGLDQQAALGISERLTDFSESLTRLQSVETAHEPMSLEELGLAAQPGQPLVYVGAAPIGGYAVVLTKGRDGKIDLEAIYAESCDSASIARLMFGVESEGKIQVPDPDVLEQGWPHNQVDASLQAMSSLLGEHLLQPLGALLERGDANGATLIPAGPIGLLPLHAMSWNTGDGATRCLIDRFEVTLAVSARVHRTCMLRASRRASGQVRLFGVANPQPLSDPLPDSELEIKLARRSLSDGEVTVVEGQTATKQRVLNELPSATHVHFACHAHSQFYDRLLSAAFALADGQALSALEIARLSVPARLVVASACETGVPQGYEEVDESLGLATAFIAAGAAGVVSTLWSIDDCAAALIISKFYEGLFEEGLPPAAALRQAQLWIRLAHEADVEEYVSERGTLRALWQRRTRSDQAGGDKPFSAPSIWAPFVFTGA